MYVVIQITLYYLSHKNCCHLDHLHKTEKKTPNKTFAQGNYTNSELICRFRAILWMTMKNKTDVTNQQEGNGTLRCNFHRKLHS